MKKFHKQFQAQVARNIRRNCKKTIKALRMEAGVYAWSRAYRSQVGRNINYTYLLMNRKDSSIFKIHLKTDFSYRTDLCGTTKRVVETNRIRSTRSIAQRAFFMTQADLTK